MAGFEELVVQRNWDHGRSRNDLSSEEVKKYNMCFLDSKKPNLSRHLKND